MGDGSWVIGDSEALSSRDGFIAYPLPIRICHSEKVIPLRAIPVGNDKRSVITIVILSEERSNESKDEIDV